MKRASLLSIMVIVLGCVADDSPPPRQIVSAYYAALHARDVEGVMELLHDDFVFRDREESFAVRRSGIRPMLAWDTATHARSEVAILETVGDRVEVRQLETNDFLELLGLGPWELHVTFVVADTAIREVILESAMELLRPVDEAIAPVVKWARQTRPEDLEGLVENETNVFDGQSASGWLALLAEARRAGVIEAIEP